MNEVPIVQGGAKQGAPLRTKRVETGDQEARGELARSLVPGLRDVVRVEADGSGPEGSTLDSRRLRAIADDILRSDASRRGQPYAKYLKKHGMSSDWDRKQQRMYEVPLGNE